MSQTGVLDIYKNDLPVLIHYISGMKILVYKSVSFRNIIDQLHQPCRLIFGVVATIRRGAYVSSRIVPGILQRARLQLDLMEFDECIRY